MKVYCVIDNYQGTDSESSCITLDSIWEDKEVAEAVAEARFALRLEEFEVYPIGTEVPGYAEEAYKKIIKRRK